MQAPSSETSRLELLHLLEVLDTAAEPAFDALVQTAAAICRCPISLFSLIDVDRQWFKARTGLDASETPRDQAFCAHAIRGREFFEVPDATRDARFAGNPLVTGDPRIRFYAGQPIVYEGIALGTLCVIDRVPRTLDDGQRATLHNLSVVLAELLHGRMQAILHRRESKRLHDFAQLSGDWLWESDAVQRLTSFEGDRAALAGLFSTSVLGEHLRDLEMLEWSGRPADDEGRLHALLARGEAFSQAVVALPGSDGERYFALTAQPIVGPRGEHLGLRGSGKDVTARIRAELLARQREREFAEAHRRLEMSERRVRAVADNLPALIAHVDRDERYTFANAAIGTVFGIDPATIIGSTMSDVRPAAAYATVKPFVDRALVGERVSFEKTTTVNGRTFHYESVYVPDFAPDGAVSGFYSLTFDLTRRREAELRQAESEKLLRGIADHLPALVCYVDVDDRFRFANDTYARWLGLDPREMVGRDYREILDAETVAALAPYVKRARSGEPVTFERRIVTGEHVRHVVTEYVPDVDADGVVLGVYALSTDITERREAAARLADSEQRLRDITNSLPAVVGEFDMQERCVFANEYAHRLFRGLPGNLAGLTFSSHIDADLYAQHRPAIEEVLDGRPMVVHGQRELGGTTRYFEANLTPAFDASGTQRGFYVMSFDVTSLKQAEIDRRHSETRLRQITDALPVIVSHLDANETMTYANGTFCRWIGIPADRIVGRTVLEAFGPELYAQRRDHLRRCLAGEVVHFDVETMVQGKPRRLQTTYLPDIGADGQVTGATTMSLDTTEQKLAEERLSQLAHVDALTGLPNRLRFNSELACALQAAPTAGDATAVMFLDVDHFKAINDTHGHAVGDGVLSAFARRVRQSVRATDFVARLAGDEFVVILRGLANASEAEDVARKVVERAGRPLTIDKRVLRITTSVGIAIHDEDARTPARLLARADAALYQAKEAGRNTYRLAA